ncbi:hypothetical protein SAMN05892883_1210 [Jatrophihabitans sp. GAS493]|uniref:hypothetical protein n=1 Tax=Jatrophihabitans sp. GAS493 TaxID=1907575 RepID=UPI000BB7E619|nr:hypothetical protein [Jatrophihabitans sp. GAS493]SOD71733.1 hypothetical protein SAMN05892883_1210 [Jatrophihabitans sp. GAS493]
MRKFPIAVGSAAAAAALTLTLAACGSDASTAASAPSKVSASATPAPTATPVPTPTPLTKAQFIVQANALCTATKKKSDAIPDPSEEGSFAAVASSSAQEEEVHSEYFAALTPLVSQAADAATLQAKWLSIENADWTASKPIFDELIAAAQAEDEAKVNTLLTAVGKTPDHSAQLAKFMTSYGLTKCAALENS